MNDPRPPRSGGKIPEMCLLWTFTFLSGSSCPARGALIYLLGRLCGMANTVQGIVWDKKWGWRMGIETLNPSNSNESQVSLRDPVRTCVPTQCMISPFRKAEIIVPDYGTRACRVLVCQTNAVLRTCVSNKRSPPCLSVKQLCLSVKQTQSSTVVHVPCVGVQLPLCQLPLCQLPLCQLPLCQLPAP